MAGTVIRMKLRDFPRYQRELGQRLLPALVRGTVSGAAACIPLLVRRTREAPAANPAGVGHGGAVNTGDYVRHWRATALRSGAVVYNSTIQSAIIEYGRRPGGGPPPLEVIARWAQRRLGLSRAEALRAAYPIARAIRRRGLLPRGVMTGAIGQMVEIVEREQLRELDQELRR